MGILLQVKAMGFNCIRLPFCDRMLEPGAMPNGISATGSDPFRGIRNGPINQELIGKTSLEILDIIIEGCGKLGLKVILDNHSRNPDAYIVEMVWATEIRARGEMDLQLGDVGQAIQGQYHRRRLRPGQ